MDYILLLKNDKSIEYKKLNDKINFKDIKYLMVPINEYGLDTYVLLKPNYYIKHFHSAKISYQLMITEIDDTTGELANKLVFQENSKEVTSLYEFINSMHSINRIEYINSLFKCDSESLKRYFVFNKFKIEVRGKDSILFHYKSKLKKDSIASTSALLSKLETVFKLEELKDEHLILNKNLWSIEKSYPENGVYSIYLYGTKSFYNVDYDTLALFKSIRSASFNTDQSICNRKGESKIKLNDFDYIDYYYHSLWYFETERILEYLVYYNMTRIITDNISELITFNEVIGSIKTFTTVTLEIFGDTDKQILILPEINNPLRYFINKLIEFGVTKNE